VLCSKEEVEIRVYRMAPFEKLYGHMWRTPVLWNKAGELKFLDPTYCKKAKDKYV
jgi:hypothetical protein